MIKKLLAFPALIILFLSEGSAQVTETTGKPIAEIFTDFHFNFNDTAKHTGFDLNRAYIGYQFLPEGNLSGKIIINAGSPDDLAEGSLSRRYAYFREASLTWSNDNLFVTIGITSTKLFEFQQRFWGKRYIAKPYQLINRYGFVADIGVVAEYKFNEIIKADLSFMNGEGYGDLQADENIRSSIGVTITPVENLVFRIYGDIQRSEDLWQPLFIGFAGFKNSLLKIGGEVSYKSNTDLIRGHHTWGISGTGGINVTEKTEIFGRYDFISSVIMPGDLIKWNYLNDGSIVILGVQHTFNPNVKIALDYQGRYPFSTGEQGTDLIYLNLLFIF
ncbi:MAG: hypothetical protein QG611_558 [Bacteroidota bacterium]|nr:hypothetical protein [Bacteroidota bacterium]